MMNRFWGTALLGPGTFATFLMFKSMLVFSGWQRYDACWILQLHRPPLYNFAVCCSLCAVHTQASSRKRETRHRRNETSVINLPTCPAVFVAVFIVPVLSIRMSAVTALTSATWQLPNCLESSFVDCIKEARTRWELSLQPLEALLCSTVRY